MRHTFPAFSVSVLTLLSACPFCGLTAAAFDKQNNYATSGEIAAIAVSDFTNPPPANALYRDPKQPIEKRIDDVLRYMTPEEKARAIHFCGGMSAGRIPRIGLGEFRTPDGASGLRAEDRPGCTYMPSGIAWAAAWDKDLVEAVGKAIGEEVRGAYPAKITPARMLLGPGLDIARSPLGARNFEYMGEDPVLGGKTAAAFTRGLASAKVSSCMKHYLLNDQEWCRTILNVDCPERALREIYSRAFVIAALEGDTWGIMTSYNAVRGQWTSQNWELNNILFEAGWDGAIMSDWGGYRNDVLAINGGLSIESPSGVNPKRDANELKLVKEGKIDAKKFDAAVRRALRLYFRVGAFDMATEADKAEQARYEASYCSKAHQDVAYRAAAASAVLLKNDVSKGGFFSSGTPFLPVDPSKVKTVALIGPNADQVHSMIDHAHLKYRGGSGAIKAAREITPLEGFCQVFGTNNVFFAPGMRFEHQKDATAVSVKALKPMDPIEAAKKADLVIFCGGLDHSYDREVLGWGCPEPNDRPDLLLKPVGTNRQEDLIRAVANVNPNIVVALTCGAPVAVDEWSHFVRAIVVTWYGGESGGRVLADIVTGKVNPSGKLPYTFGRKLTDWPCHNPTMILATDIAKVAAEFKVGTDTNSLVQFCWPGVRRGADGKVFPKIPSEGWDPAREYYADDIWVGYRGFDRFGTAPSYPFGFGLSYTTFKIEPAEGMGYREGIFSVKVTNTGKRAGREVVQCYVSKPSVEGVEMPVKELIDFASVELAPGETKIVTFKPGADYYRYWSVKDNAWRTPKGTFKIRIGDSSANLPVVFPYEMSGEGNRS